MPNNFQVAELLRQYASALVVQGADRFKVKAYRRAADSLESASKNVEGIVKRGGDLEELPGVGKAIAGKIKDIVTTGKLPQLERALSALSPELVELAAKPGLDPKQVLRVYKRLGIKSLAELKRRLDAGDIASALGMRVDFQIRQGLDDRPRILLWTAEDLAQRVERHLAKIPGVTKVARTGSLRRKQETIGDLNFLVAGKTAADVFKQFAEFGAVQAAEPLGRRTMRYQLSAGRTVTVTWTPLKEWGLAHVTTTGSAFHVKQLKERAAKRRVTLSAKTLGISAATEKAVYAKLRLENIEPELREGYGEIEAAAKGKLPQLVTVSDLRGDLHMHTTASDGANSIVEMADAAKERGYQYIAITDHSQSLKITNGLTERRLFAHIKAIDKHNARLAGITILKSAEVDILEDGKLDYSNAALKELDLTICSIHSRFALNKEQQTERIMRAMDNPYFNIFGHATGRLLLKRQGYEVDIERLIEHAAERGCYFEINSSPDRLDLSDEHARMAKEAGLKVAVNTDAHSITELNFISAGIGQARRAWLESQDVLNAHPLGRLRRLLRR